MERSAARLRMVEWQIAGRGISDARVLRAMSELPRQLFVPASFTAEAYEDCPLPIGCGQTISQPYIVGLSLELLELTGVERVLEIGTGSGYQTALLARLAAEVWSVERIPELAARAGALLSELGAGNIRLRCGDGYEGWPDAAPFDAIVVSAAPEELPRDLLEQLSPEGGRLVGPVGPIGRQRLIRVLRSGGSNKTEAIADVAFVPMLHGVASGT